MCQIGTFCRPQRSTPRTISTQKLEKFKGREGASEAQNGRPQRSAPRTLLKCELKQAQAEAEAQSAQLSSSYSGLNVCREKNGPLVLNSMPAYSLHREEELPSKSTKCLAEAICAFFRRDVHKEIDQNGTSARVDK